MEIRDRRWHDVEGTKEHIIIARKMISKHTVSYDEYLELKKMLDEFDGQLMRQVATGVADGTDS